MANSKKGEHSSLFLLKELHQLDGQSLTILFPALAGEPEEAHAGRETGIIKNFLDGFIFMDSYQNPS